MTSKTKQEWITTAELCERLDCSKAVVGRHRKAGKMDAKQKSDKVKTLLWPWPKAKEQYEAAQKMKREQINAHAGRPKFDINSAEYADLMAWEKVVAAVEMGAKNAPDIAYAYMKAIEQQVKTRLATIKLLEAEDKTLPKEEVENFIFTSSRNNRDVWLNWPEIVSVKMAEELGVPAKKCHDVLKKYVIQQLDRNATMPISIAGDVDEVLPERSDAT